MTKQISNDSRIKFIETIHKIRKLSSLTNNELSEKTGLSINTIKKIETDCLKVSYFSIKKYLHALGYSLEIVKDN